jgi:hypothetical protein
LGGHPVLRLESTGGISFGFKRCASHSFVSWLAIQNSTKKKETHPSNISTVKMEIFISATYINGPIHMNIYPLTSSISRNYFGVRITLLKFPLDLVHGITESIKQVVVLVLHGLNLYANSYYAIIRTFELSVMNDYIVTYQQQQQQKPDYIVT